MSRATELVTARMVHFISDGTLTGNGEKERRDRQIESGPRECYRGADRRMAEERKRPYNVTVVGGGSKKGSFEKQGTRVH